MFHSELVVLGCVLRGCIIWCASLVKNIRNDANYLVCVVNIRVKAKRLRQTVTDTISAS